MSQQFANLPFFKIIVSVKLITQFCLRLVCPEIFSCFWPGIHQRTGSCQYWIVNFAEFDSVEVFNIISWTLAILYFTWRPFWFWIKIIQLRNTFRGTSVLRGSLRKTLKWKVSIFVVKLLLIKCRIANTFDSKDTAFDHKTFLRVLFQT